MKAKGTGDNCMITKQQRNLLQEIRESLSKANGANI